MHQNGDTIDAAAEEIRNLGYTVIDSGFSTEELQVIARNPTRSMPASMECGGEANLERMKDSSIARCVISYDDYFVRLAAHDQLSVCLEDAW